MDPTSEEKNSLEVLTLLKECGIPTGKYSSSYGRPETLDKDTASLCDWCKQHATSISRMSLELQIWWRDHQKADKKRKAREEAAYKRGMIRAKALLKLSPEEKEALGVKDGRG